MTSADLIPAAVLKRKAVVYVRQSTQSQVMTNLEGQRRQYDLVEVARQWGFADVEVIDDDLGRSASGMVARPGFDRLVAWLCAGKVGAVLCFDASRLARNGRDWHHLLELCGLVEARVIDLDGVYNPCRPNDRLLLGMKGQRVRVGRLTRPHAGRRAVQSAPRRAAAIRSLRLYLAPRSRARFGSRPASTGGDPAHLHPLPRTWQRPPSAAIDEGGSYPLPEAVGRRPDDELRMDADPLPQCHRDSEEPILCRCICVREKREAHRDHRWPGAQKLWPRQTGRYMGGDDQRSRPETTP
jgi:DNA invertase Pin-like site-specific DNA recombinase